MAALLAAAFIVELPCTMAYAGSPSHSRTRITVAIDYAVPPTRLPVKEPQRVRPSIDLRSATRPRVVPGIRPANGVRMAGPPMLRPDQVLTAIRAPRQQFAAPVNQRPRSVAPTNAVPHGSGFGPVRSSTSSATRSVQSLPNNPSGSGTGINPWWRYQEQNVPGGGHVMVNVGTGNLVLQEDDMAVPHKGIELALRRTYNSQSLRDVNVDDGAGEYWMPAGMYGNGWTNTFDAHVARNADGTIWSVYDIDGARYDYAHVPGSSTWTAPPGQHATLAYDSGCGVYWTKKSGSIYHFYVPNPAASCPSLASLGGYAGRLYQIIARNSNAYLTFGYSWDNGNASTTGKVSAITVQTESGLAATLSFVDVNGHRLLQQLTFPDGTTNVTYGYDSSGDLVTVSRPPNNSSGTRPVQLYGYGPVGNNSILAYAASPRYYAGCGAAGCGSDGETLYFGFLGTSVATSTLGSIVHYGVVNPTIVDGTGVALQSGYSTTAFTFLTEYYTTGVTTPTYRDTDGHMTNWVFDAYGRPTQTQECGESMSQGSVCTGTWLVSNETWDANNNLTATVDPRGNETDEAYDANGNTVAMAQPAPYYGAFRPTHLLSYDANNNVTASCDPVATHSLGLDWISPPAPPAPGNGLCPQNSTAATRMVWTSVSYEPDGELTSLTTPATSAALNGYSRTYSYDSDRQGGADFGLPTAEVGGVTTDSGRQPRQDFWYDANGNLVCYSKGNGQWILGYDTLQRMVWNADPDDSTHSSSSCTKSGAQAGWNTSRYTTYYADGQTQAIQSASQSAAGVATTYTYDLDGNEQSETHHYGCLTASSCTAGVTSKWYDGEDRLVEVSLPYDGWDVQAYPMMTRYIYDLSGGLTTPYRGLNLKGHGNLVETQLLLSGAVWTPFAAGQITRPAYSRSTASWLPVRATVYDALDRVTTSYEAAFGDQPKLVDVYDGSGHAGLLSSEQLATGEVKTYLYDSDGRKTDVQYRGGSAVTPNLHFAFDADGRETTKHTDALGDEVLQFDHAGELTSDIKPAALGGATVSYDYFEDGARKDLNFASSTFTVPQLYQYSYRPDGLRQKLQLSNGSAFQWTYTQAGRLLTQTDPLTGTTITPDNCYMSQKGACSKLYYPAVTYGPNALTRDMYGRVQAQALPETPFTYSAMTYDLEDGIAQETETSAQAPANVVTTRCLQSTIRDAKPPYIAPEPCANGDMLAYPAIYNSAVFGRYTPVSPPGNQVIPWTIDARAGMLLSWQAPQSDGNADGAQYSYDLSGRLVGDNEQLDMQWPGSTNSGIRLYTTGTRTKAYDAENRLRAQTSSVITSESSGSSGGWDVGGYWWHTDHQPFDIASIDYDADGHPSLFSLQNTINHPAYPMTYIWLWDGNDRLVECQSSSTTAPPCGSGAFSVEGLADYSPSGGIIIYDRDSSGAVVTRHDHFGFMPWTSGLRPHWLYNLQSPPTAGPSSEQFQQFGYAYDGKLTADGWTLDNNTWQGVRTFDASVGQWNTPDAYAGDVHDPMSQQPYMWNRNNPFAYADPTGYDSRANEEAIEAELLFGGIEETALARAQLRLAIRQTAASEKLANIGKALFRAGPQAIRGGTPGAIRYELKTGNQVGGKYHLEKGATNIRALRSWLVQNPQASEADREQAERWLKDLKDAYGGQDPEHYIGNNRPQPTAPETK